MMKYLTFPEIHLYFSKKFIGVSEVRIENRDDFDAENIFDFGTELISKALLTNTQSQTE